MICKVITMSSCHNPMKGALAKSFQSCSTLCDPIDGSPPGSPVPGILQARTLEWVAISFSNARKVKSEREVAESCPTLRDPMDCSLPGSSVHGIFKVFSHIDTIAALVLSTIFVISRKWMFINHAIWLDNFDCIYSLTSFLKTQKQYFLICRP